MSNLTDKFIALESQIDDDADEAQSQRASIISSLEDVQAGLASINSDMLQMKSALLAAMGQNDPCATCPPPSLITPTTSPTPHPINTDKCKRVQAFINAIHEITGVFGAATDNGIFWSPSIVTSGISEVVTTLITGGTVPLPSFGESVNIAGDAINYGLSNIGRNNNLQSQFDTISSGMVTGLYNTSSPSAVQAEYVSLVDASDLPNDEKLLFKALGFNSLFSFFFDPDSSPDLTPYDGAACPFPDCITFSVDEMHFVTGEFGGGYVPNWDKYGITLVSLPGQDNPVWVCVQANNATWDNTGFDNVYHQRQDDPTGGTLAETGTFASLSVSNWITCVSPDGPFAITLCGILPAGSCS